MFTIQVFRPIAPAQRSSACAALHSSMSHSLHCTSAYIFCILQVQVLSFVTEARWIELERDEGLKSQCRISVRSRSSRKYTGQ